MGRATICFSLLAVVLTCLPGASASQDRGNILGGISGAIVRPPLRQATPPPPRLVEPPPLSQREINLQVQSNLLALGFNTGPIDGVLGQSTRTSLVEFQTLAKLPVTGLPDPNTIRILRLAAALRPSAVDTADAITQANISVNRSMAINASTPTQQRQSTSTRPSVLDTNGREAESSSPQPTRRFSAARDFPPSEYRGYGIVAFKSLATDYDILRHNVICEAYVSSLGASSDSARALNEQFVTIWPLASGNIASSLNSLRGRPSDVCGVAIEHYDLQTSANAILQAKKAGFDDQGVGPFLLGWLPGDGFGKGDALILVLDLSKVNSYGQAQSLFQEWKSDIQSDPQLMQRNLSLERLRRGVRRWSDSYGPGFFNFIKGN